MRRWKYLIPVIVVLVMLAFASLACSVEDAIFGSATDTPYPTNEYEATLTAAYNATRDAATPYIMPSLREAFGDGIVNNANQLSDLYSSDSVITTPFSGLFGNMDQVSTIQSLQNAIPDLKINWRMTIQQNDWAAWSFDISGTFTQPLVTANATLPPTNQPWFTTVQSLFHVNPAGKIDKEYSSADMVAMMHEAGVAGYKNVKVGDIALEKPMTQITPSTDPAAATAAAKLTAAAGNGPFFMWLPSGVPNDLTTDVTFHSPYGDHLNDVSDVEQRLMDLQDAHVEVPMIIHEGNNIGLAFTYIGTIAYPVKFKDGTIIPASNETVQFSGVIVGTVDAKGNGEGWALFNRLDNPITNEHYGAAGAASQATPSAADVTATPSAGSTLPATTTSSGTSASCTVTAPKIVNLRKGPGTSFAVGGKLEAGQTADADGQSRDSDGQTWLHLASLNLWTRSDIVSGDCSTLASISANGG